MRKNRCYSHMQLGISNAGERVFHYEVMSSYTLVLLLPLLLGYIQQQTYMFAVPFHCFHMVSLSSYYFLQHRLFIKDFF